jgi:glycerate kinase
MIFLLTPDSFKESMTAAEACTAMESGIKSVFPDASCIRLPVADGGDGTLDLLMRLHNATGFSEVVTGPLGHKVNAKYALAADGLTGFMELAAASGLHLVPADARNPMITTTYGTGELIKKIIAHGAKKLVIGIGGSATNDGGAGLVQALGGRLLDAAGKEIGFGGGELGRIAKIDTSALITNQLDFQMIVACDVNNPLTGANGASRIYGPQKGADEVMVEQLDNHLKHYAGKIEETTGIRVDELPGAGAAGGTGAALAAFFKAELLPGTELMMKYLKAEDQIKKADFIFTGEGSIDAQTLNGKALSGIIKLALQYGKPVIAFAGRINEIDKLYQSGLTAAFGILPGISSLGDALSNGAFNLQTTVSSVCRLISLQQAAD